MRRLLLFTTLLLFSFHMEAAHLVGGELSYKCLSSDSTGNTYQIKLTIYRDCNSQGAAFDPFAPISIYGGPNQTTLIQTLTPSGGLIVNIPVVVNNPCLQAPPNVCTEKRTYVANVTLPQATHGYTLVYQRCCRNNTISNVNNSGAWGNTYYITIPPMDQRCNGSASFLSDPPVALCRDDSLYLDFSVFEPDGDSLFYTLCQPIHGGSQQNPDPNPPAPPPYTPVPFTVGLNYAYPLPSNPAIDIDPVTGILTGTPMASGQYVFAVCVEEYDSNGVLLSNLRRDYQFNVTPCQSSVLSDPTPQIYQPQTFCNGTTVNFKDSSLNAQDYLWIFNDPGNPGAQSTFQSPTYTFSDTGTYTIQLVINPGWNCADTADVTYELYNPVTPAFSFAGEVCFDINNIIFQNQSSNGGNASATWDFGPNASIPSWNGWNPPAIQFSTWGDQIVSLTVEEQNCEDTFIDTVRIYRYPEVDFAIESQTGCAPFEVEFWDSTITDGKAIYQWDFGDGTLSSNSSPTYTYDIPGTYDISLEVWFLEGCTDTITVVYDDFITVLPSPISNFSLSTNNTTIYTSSVTFADLSSGTGNQLFTQMGDGSLYLNNPGFVHVYTDTGWFEVEHVVINAFDCPDTSTQLVRINPETLVFVPTAFTPDEDGTNDVFFATAVGVNSFEMKIFDRWGNEVFSTSDPYEGWDGNYPNGGPATEGAYSWTVLARDAKDNLLTKKGILTLLR